MKNKIPPPLWMIFTGFLMWLLDHQTPQFHVSIPHVVIVRTLVTLLGAAMMGIAIYQFAKLKTTVNPLEPQCSTSLCTRGIYRLSRNPMYLGLVVLLLGWAIHLANPLNIALIAGFMMFITQCQIKPEETALKKIFGEEFTLYCRKVRRWL